MTVPMRIPAQMLYQEVQQLAHSIRSAQYPWWYPEQAKSLTIQYAVLGTDFVPLALSATVRNTIQVPGNWAFLILAASLVETDILNTTFLANRPLLTRLTDAASQEDLANIPIHVDNWFGTAELPMLWPVPRILAPNQAFGVEMANLEAVARNVRVAFHGIKVYNYRSGA